MNFPPCLTPFCWFSIFFSRKPTGSSGETLDEYHQSIKQTENEMKTAKDILSQPRPTKLPIGIPELDRELGGFGNGYLVAIGCQSSFLLPALTRRLALHAVATLNRPVAIFRPGHEARATCEKLPESALDAPLYFFDKRGMTADDIFEQLDKLPAPPCLVIVDQAELLDPWFCHPISAEIPEPLNQEMAEIRTSHAIKQLAKTLDCPIVINVGLPYWRSNGTFINSPSISHAGGLATAADLVLHLDTGTKALTGKPVSLEVLFNKENLSCYAKLHYQNGNWL